MAFPSDVVGYLLLAAALLDGVAAPSPRRQLPVVVWRCIRVARLVFVQLV
jgi:hypothetical protein